MLSKSTMNVQFVSFHWLDGYRVRVCSPSCCPRNFGFVSARNLSERRFAMSGVLPIGDIDVDDMIRSNGLPYGTHLRHHEHEAFASDMRSMFLVNSGNDLLVHGKLEHGCTFVSALELLTLPHVAVDKSNQRPLIHIRDFRREYHCRSLCRGVFFFVL